MSTAPTRVDLRPDHWAIVRNALRRYVPDREVLVFGSRASGTAKEYSDLDLAIMGDEPLSLREVSALDEALGESDLPFKVDIVEWARIDEGFRRIIRGHGVVVRAPSDGRCGTSPEPASDWLSCTVAEACSAIDYGLTKAASNRPSGQKFLRITDIVSGQIDWNTVPYVTVGSRTAEKYRLYHDDIVLARTGASTGVSAYITNPPPAVFASYLVRLRTRPGFDGRFLAYYLRSERFRHYMRGVLGDKSAQPNASASTMTAAPFRAPRDPSEQRAIAHILGTLDDKIELNRRMNRTLEAMARALFKSWFVDFDPVRAKMEGRDTGLPQDIADLFPDRLVDSEMSEIPERWEATSLGTVIEIHDRKRIPLNKRQRAERQGPYPYYGAAGIMDYVNDFLFDGVYILTGEDGSVVDAHGHPVVQYVWGKFWVNNHAHVLKGRKDISDEHLYLLLQRANITAFVTGAVQPKLNQKNLKAIPLVLPTGPACRVFSGLVAPLFARVRHNADESERLVALRDALLPKLISGEIRVQYAETVLESVT